MSSLPPSESTATTQEVRGRPLKSLNRNDPIDNAFRLVSMIDVGCVFFSEKNGYDNRQLIHVSGDPIQCPCR